MFKLYDDSIATDNFILEKVIKSNDKKSIYDSR